MTPTTVYQMAPHYNYGDAIGNQITTINRLLQEWGFATDIFADYIEKRLTATPYREYAEVADDDSWLIYHYSIGTEVNPFVLEQGKNVILIYHNITPPHFFAPFEPKTAALCQRGIDTLQQFAPKVRLAAGVSDFNRQELADLGFDEPQVAPLILDIAPKELAPPLYDDGMVNILFVGRVAPNKRHEDLIKVFHFYKNYVNPNSRLLLVGRYAEKGSYYQKLRRLVSTLDLPDVIFTGSVTDEELARYFSSAHVFLSLSRHEGFCAPLLEAMSYRLPVAALARAAVPETLGYAGALIDEMAPHKIAEMIDLLATDEALRHQVIEAQLARLDDFSLEKSAAIFRHTLDLAFDRAAKSAA